MSGDAAETPLEDYSLQDRELADALFRDNYESLLKIARMRRRRAQLNTMSTVDLLHESYLRLGNSSQSWQSTEHFQRTASLAMRHVIVDHARRRVSQKRGGAQADRRLESVEDVLPGFSESPEQVVMIADLMSRMAEEKRQWLRIVDARYFAGMTEEETALLYGVSVRTVRREWKAAKAWLADAMDARMQRG